MAIEAAFQNLHTQLQTLHEKVAELNLNLDGYFPKVICAARGNGQPPAGDKQLPPPPVVNLANEVIVLASAIEQTMFAAEKAARKVRPPRKLLEAQSELITIHGCLNGALKTFIDHVLAYDAVHALKKMARRLHHDARKQAAAAGTQQALRQMARDSGGTWPQWVWVVKQAIDDCHMPMHASVQAVAECWQELSEKLAADSVVMQATNIGQQITMREDQESAAVGAA